MPAAQGTQSPTGEPEGGDRGSAPEGWLVRIVDDSVTFGTRAGCINGRPITILTADVEA